MIITKHFDNPDRAQAFVVMAFDSDWAEYYGLDFNLDNTEHYTIWVCATYPGGRFARNIILGEVEHAQSDEAITEVIPPDKLIADMFASWVPIFGGKQ